MYVRRSAWGDKRTGWQKERGDKQRSESGHWLERTKGMNVSSKRSGAKAGRNIASDGGIIHRARKNHNEKGVGRKKGGERGLRSNIR